MYNFYVQFVRILLIAANQNAINFVVNVEEGSEASLDDGDTYTESSLTELGTQKSEVSERDLGAESMFEYGARVGMWRLFRRFSERSIPLTIYACALALERNPFIAEEIKKQDYDICGHGWRWEKHFANWRATSF